MWLQLTSSLLVSRNATTCSTPRRTRRIKFFSMPAVTATTRRKPTAIAFMWTKSCTRSSEFYLDEEMSIITVISITISFISVNWRTLFPTSSPTLHCRVLKIIHVPSAVRKLDFCRSDHDKHLMTSFSISGHREAVFFQAQTRRAEEEMRLYYVCTNQNCSHRWTEWCAGTFMLFQLSIKADFIWQRTHKIMSNLEYENKWRRRKKTFHRMFA